MLIKLSAKQEAALLAWITPITKAEVDAECEPSGYYLEIEIGGPFGASACASSGNAKHDIGEVEVVLGVC